MTNSRWGDWTLKCCWGCGIIILLTHKQIPTLQNINFICNRIPSWLGHQWSIFIWLGFMCVYDLLNWITTDSITILLRIVKVEFRLNRLCYVTIPPPALFLTIMWGDKQTARPFPSIHSGLHCDIYNVNLFVSYPFIILASKCWAGVRHSK